MTTTSANIASGGGGIKNPQQKITGKKNKVKDVTPDKVRVMDNVKVKKF